MFDERGKNRFFFDFCFLIFFSIGAVFLSSSCFADDVETQSNGTFYVCTGIGESKEDPRWAEYPLKLIFTGSGRGYLSDVRVVIKDLKGGSLLQTNCDSPWLLVKLPDGNYSVTASIPGASDKKVTVHLKGPTQKEFIIRFPEIKSD